MWSGLRAVLLFCLWAGQAAGQQPPDQLHHEALVWDCHSDLSYRVLYEDLDIGQRLPAGHVETSPGSRRARSMFKPSHFMC